MKEFLIPRVTFDIAPLDMEADMFYSFTHRQNDQFRSIFERVYPELFPLMDSAKDTTEAIIVCREFVGKLHSDNKDIIETARVETQAVWNSIGSDFLRTLSEHFETEWPEDKPEIVGYMSVLPVSPRFLDTFSFCTGYTNTVSTRVEVSAHEILHFLWFKKWKEVFPEMERKTYETPHLVWRLSEIMDPIILQCHPKIKGVIRPKQWGYGSFKTIKIGDVSMTEHFKRVYEDAARANVDFAETLRILWDEIQKHEEQVSVF